MDEKSTEQVAKEIVEKNQVENLTPATVGEPQTPSKPIEEIKEEVKPSSDEVQRRIDRMYARMKDEEDRRKRAEAERDELRQNQTQRQPEEFPTDELNINTVKATVREELSKKDRELELRERQNKMRDKEVDVLKRHPSALNDDGTFNLKDPFVMKYIEVGKKNPGLASMLNGPEIAEIVAEKELGLDYSKGRKDEANRLASADNAHTGTSSVAPIPKVNIKITEKEQVAARRFHMTDDEYVKQRDGGRRI